MGAQLLVISGYSSPLMNEFTTNLPYPVFMLTVMLPFYYIIFCVNWAMFSLEVEGFVGLNKKNTDSYSLLFYAENFSKLSAPICFNYIQLIGDSHSSFVGYMKRATLTKAGSLSLRVIAFIFICLVLLNIFNMLEKVLAWFGMEFFQHGEQDQVNLSNDFQSKIEDLDREIYLSDIEVDIVLPEGH